MLKQIIASSVENFLAVKAKRVIEKFVHGHGLQPRRKFVLAAWLDKAVENACLRGVYASGWHASRRKEVRQAKAFPRPLERQQNANLPGVLVADLIKKYAVGDAADRYIPCDAAPDKIKLAFGFHLVNDQVRPGRHFWLHWQKRLLTGNNGFDVMGDLATEHVGYDASPKRQENLLAHLAVKSATTADQLKKESAVGACLFAKIHFVPLQ
ncbi:hypothetical protein J3R75_000208 [Oligosphaera ethanolica]|uniref:Uncharacterized protein n=1 Tax=Oligosphaera ethanolica TaxID=760260 RepID=A0AAE4AM50_9BACT|nr:hypothetical protein [Oligosphaera ethanolica]MDQ0288101.1 hypothetical protein [Oligosphaera ethanolica]